MLVGEVEADAERVFLFRAVDPCLRYGELLVEPLQVRRRQMQVCQRRTKEKTMV